MRRSPDGLGQCENANSGALGVQSLAYGPGNAAVVGHAHYNAGFSVEHAHGLWLGNRVKIFK